MKMKNKTASLAIIVALAAAVILSSGLVLTPHASALKNICETQKSNPNCQPAPPGRCLVGVCRVFVPGSASPNK
jgi:hypothetical protein